MNLCDCCYCHFLMNSFSSLFLIIIIFNFQSIKMSLFSFFYLKVEHILEKAMATHSSTLDWKIPWTEESGRLQSMESQRVQQDWVTSLSLFACMHWRRKWQPTPVFLPGESQGWGSLVGYRLWGRRVGHDWSDLAAAATCIFMFFQFWEHKLKKRVF